MKRRQPCDGCGAERKRWQRLCGACFSVLPGDVRTGLIAAHREGRKTEWRALVRRARDIIANRVGRPSAQVAYKRTQAMLGERDT